MRVLKFICFLIPAMAMWGCFPPRDYPEPLTTYKPMLMERQELNNSIIFQQPRRMLNPGKIFYKDPYIFIVDQYEGVHVIDNTNTSNPVKVGFIRIPGCNDIAIKNSIMYADNATDLVTIDFNSPLNPVVVSRKQDVFPEAAPPDLGRIPEQYSKESRPGDLVIVGWIKTKK